MHKVLDLIPSTPTEIVHYIINIISIQLNNSNNNNTLGQLFFPLMFRHSLSHSTTVMDYIMIMAITSWGELQFFSIKIKSSSLKKATLKLHILFLKSLEHAQKNLT